jgi:hypothetical protein
MHTPIKFTVPEQTDEQRKENKQRLQQWVDEWNAFSQKHPDLAGRMVA